VFTPEGLYLRKFGSEGAGAGQLSFPTGIAIDGDRVYVAEHGNNRVSVFSTEGRFLKSFGQKGREKSQFKSPHTIHVSKDRFILIADRCND